MTDLQMSLIAAGGVFVVGVISYNKWQEHKARKSVERAFSSEHDDVLMRTGAAPEPRQEPSFELGGGGGRSSDGDGAADQAHLKICHAACASVAKFAADSMSTATMRDTPCSCIVTPIS